MEKLTKQEIKGPDVFIKQANKLADFTNKHKKTMFMAFVGLSVLGTLWAGWGIYMDAQEGSAQTLLYNANKKLKAKDEASALTDFKQTVNKHSLTQGAAIAALQASKIYFEQNKYQEAIELLEKVSSSAKGIPIRALILNNLGLNYEAKGDCTKAIDYWNQIESRDDMLFMHGNILLKKGLCYEKLGQKDKAEQMYKKAEGFVKNPDVVSTAKKYLRVLR